MKMSHSIETYQLNAYLDGELSLQECLEVEKALETNVTLRKQFEQMKSLKKKVLTAYEDIPEPKTEPNNKAAKPVWFFPSAIAASMFLGLIIGGTFFKGTVEQNYLLPAINQEVAANYLVHIDSDNPEKQIQAIQEIEMLLETGGPSTKVDLISNYKGVGLFDVNNKNNAELTRLLNTYDNLTLFACKRALERAKKNGHAVQLMPQVEHEQPAIDAVVERLNSGWRYKKI